MGVDSEFWIHFTKDIPMLIFVLWVDSFFRNVTHVGHELLTYRCVMFVNEIKNCNSCQIVNVGVEFCTVREYFMHL